MQNDEVFILCQIIGIILCILLGYAFNEVNRAYLVTDHIHDWIFPPHMPASEEEIVNDCQGLNIINTADCLNREVSSVYHYVVRDDTDKNFSDIAQNGGDCYDYSGLYARLAGNLSFWTNTVVIRTNSSAHRLAIIHDQNGYCILEQNLKPWCMEYGPISQGNITSEFAKITQGLFSWRE